MKSFTYTCIALANKTYEALKNDKGEYWNIKYSDFKEKMAALWDKLGLVWVNEDGNFPIGNKSGFDGIFPKIMTVLIGHGYYFKNEAVLTDFKYESARYYEEHLELNVHDSAIKFLDRKMAQIERHTKNKSPFIDYKAEDEFKAYIESLEMPDQFDMDNVHVGIFTAQYIIETMSHTKKIKPGEFVTLRNKIYELAYKESVQFILKGVSDCHD